MRGLYGRSPGPISKEILEITKEGPISVRPADLLPPMWEKVKNELPAEFVEKEEDYLTYALLPNVAGVITTAVICSLYITIIPLL